MAKKDTSNEQKQLNQMQGTFWNNYNAAVPNATQNYNDIMGAYKNYASNPFGNPFGNTNPYGTPSAPSGTTTAQGNLDPRSWVVQEATRLGRTDIANNPDYWAGVISQQGPTIDTGYWSDRMASANNGGSGSTFGGYTGSFNPGSYAGYQAFANGGNGIGMDPEFRGALTSAIGGYQNFANTGGFSPQDIQDIRARAIGPTRSIYSSAQSNIDRQRALQGGYSPNYTAATAKMARDLSQQISDANVNANASIAQMIQQGKLAGLGGLSSTGASGAGLQSQIDQFNRNLQLAGLQGMTGLDEFGAQLGLSYNQLNQAAKQFGLSGMSQLYGETPGLARMFGDQALQAAQLGSNNAARTQGFPWSQVLGGAGTALNLISSLGGNSTLGKVGTAIGGKSIPNLVNNSSNSAPSFIGPTMPAGTLGGIPINEGLTGLNLPASTSVTLPGMTTNVGSGATSASALSNIGGALGTAGMMMIPSVAGMLMDKFGTNVRPLDQYSIDQNQQTADDMFNTYGMPTEGYNPYSMYLIEHPEVKPYGYQ